MLVGALLRAEREAELLVRPRSLNEASGDEQELN